MLDGRLYNSRDDEISYLYRRARALTDRYNSSSPDDAEARPEILRQLFDKDECRFHIVPPFRCDYGVFIDIGEDTFINYDCIILDACRVVIGSHVLIGPRTCIYSVLHPIDAGVRAEGYNTSKPVTIKDRVWLGGNVVVNPSVTIGENTVIGSGSVVTRDIPANVVAAGNPCRVIREITEQDSTYWIEQRNEYLALNDKGNFA